MPFNLMYWTPVLEGSLLEYMEKHQFFRVAMARVGKYGMGVFGPIGVYIVNHLTMLINEMEKY